MKEQQRFQQRSLQGHVVLWLLIPVISTLRSCRFKFHGHAFAHSLTNSTEDEATGLNTETPTIFSPEERPIVVGRGEELIASMVILLWYQIEISGMFLFLID